MPKSQAVFFHAVSGAGWILERGLVLELQLGGLRVEQKMTAHTYLKPLTTREGLAGEACRVILSLDVCRISASSTRMFRPWGSVVLALWRLLAVASIRIMQTRTRDEARQSTARWFPFSHGMRLRFLARSAALGRWLLVMSRAFCHGSPGLIPVSGSNRFASSVPLVTKLLPPISSVVVVAVVVIVVAVAAVVVAAVVVVVVIVAVAAAAVAVAVAVSVLVVVVVVVVVVVLVVHTPCTIRIIRAIDF